MSLLPLGTITDSAANGATEPPPPPHLAARQLQHAPARFGAGVAPPPFRPTNGSNGASPNCSTRATSPACHHDEMMVTG